MSTSGPSEHRDEILDQFTRQAVPFSTAPGIKDEAALRLIVEFSGAGPEDTLLDVACGGGLVVIVVLGVRGHRELVRMVRSVAGLVYQESEKTRARLDEVFGRGSR